MTVLSRLLGAAPAPTKSLPDRIAELDSQSADVVASVALGDDAEALRIAAIGKLPVGEALTKLAVLNGEATGSAVARAAQQRLAQLLDSGAFDFGDFLRATPDLAARLAVAALCGDSGRLHQVIAAIDDAESLCKLAVEAPATKVRQLAAEALTDPAHLRQVLKDARGKDKNVYKIVKAKFDGLHAQEKAAADTQAAIAAICAALERHMHQPLDNLFVPTLDHLTSQWSTVAPQAPEEIKTRAEQASERCRRIIAQHQQKLAGEAARAAAIAGADADRHDIVNELRALLAAVFTATAQNVDQHLARITSRWIEIAGHKAPSKDDKACFEQLSNAIVSLAQLTAQYGSVQQQGAAFADASAALNPQTLKRALGYATLLDESAPPDVAEAAAALASWEHARQEQHSAESHALRQVGGLIRKALGTLNAGHSRQAAGLRRAIEDKLHALPSVPPHLSAQLQALDEKLNVLQDWRSYAVAPKRIELIEQMEALLGSEEKPQALADRIKGLQEEWKTVNKGAADHAEAEWQRFHEAAQKAYEPCREYFAAQAKMRAANLEKRKALLARVTQFVTSHNWEQPDWREVAKALREARQLWRAHQQVDRAANKSIQDQFDAVLADLEHRLDGESAKNVAEKKRLIARAQHLLTLDDSRQAIDEVKRLQAAWKDVGIVSHEDSQLLWEEFRKHCDAVFAKKQTQFNEQRAAFDATKTKALELCVEVEQLAALSGSELPEGAKKLAALREAFEAIGELPKANARDLNQRFDRAVQRVQAALAQQRAREKAQGWDRVLEAGDQIRLYRRARIQQLPSDEIEVRKQAAQTFIDSVQHWPKGALQAVKNELTKDGATDFTANDTALRTLCIRAEILTDTPTPSSDQTFRRAYQLQQLTQGMGQASSGAGDLDLMVLEWIAVGAMDEAVYRELLARFNACRAKAVRR